MRLVTPILWLLGLLTFSLLSWWLVLYAVYVVWSWLLAAWSWPIVRLAVVIGAVGFCLFLLSENLGEFARQRGVRR